MNRTNRTALVALALTLGASPSWAQDAPSCQTLRMADVGWVDNGAINGLTMAVAEGLGYKDQLKGKIYGIESGAGGNQLIKTMIEENRYDLGDFKLVESSETAMRLQVARAIRKQEPIVFLGWAPHPMNLQFDMTYLSGADDLWGPDGGAAKVHTVMANDYQTRCPNAAKLASNMKFDIPMESHMMERIMDKEPAVQAAKQWIAKNPQWLDTWLEGVTTFDGQDGKAAVIKHLKL